MIRITITSSGGPARRVAESSRVTLVDGHPGMQIEASSSVADVLLALGFDPASPPLVMLDGRRIAPAEFADVSPCDGASLSLLPTIRAG